MTNCPSHRELFRRAPDERFQTLQALSAHCRERKERSQDRWIPPAHFAPWPRWMNSSSRRATRAGSDELTGVFPQLCSLSKVSKDTGTGSQPTTQPRFLGDDSEDRQSRFKLITEEGRLRSLTVRATPAPQCRGVSMLQESRSTSGLRPLV